MYLQIQLVLKTYIYMYLLYIEFDYKCNRNLRIANRSVCLLASLLRHHTRIAIFLLLLLCRTQTSVISYGISETEIVV